MKRTDGEIKKDVMDALHWDSRVDATGIAAETRDGAVRLSGTVSSLTTRTLAEELTYGVTGVRSVVNELTVNSPETVIKDGEIISYIKNILSWNSSINAEKVDLAVKEGTVTLTGAVYTYWEKIKAEDLVSQVNGVREVVNELAVVPAKNYEDAEIARRIVDNLERNLYTDAGRLTVKVDKGHVTISGAVPGTGHKTSAYEVIRHIEGVRSIKTVISTDNHEES